MGVGFLVPLKHRGFKAKSIPTNPNHQLTSERTFIFHLLKPPGKTKKPNSDRFPLKPTGRNNKHIHFSKWKSSWPGRKKNESEHRSERDGGIHPRDASERATSASSRRLTCQGTRKGLVLLRGGAPLVLKKTRKNKEHETQAQNNHWWLVSFQGTQTTTTNFRGPTKYG